MMLGAQKVREHFRRQADACRRFGSPFTARISDLTADRLTDGTRSGERILSWPDTIVDDNLALRFCGALHALVLNGRAADLVEIYPPDGPLDPSDDDLWRCIECALTNHDDFIIDWLSSPPQTNEVGRAAMILPALMQVADTFGKPLALYEIGASGGLNMQLAGFCYNYDGIVRGNPASPVQLSPEVRTPPYLSPELPQITSRQGCDINPLDPADETQALRLRSYVWPDQTDRQDRLTGAIALSVSDPPNVEKSDAAVWVVTKLQSRPVDVISVFYHTIVWQYFSEQTDRELLAAFNEAGRNCGPASPLALIGMDAATSEYALLHLTTWSGDKARDGERIELARVDYQGHWIDWRA